MSASQWMNGRIVATDVTIQTLLRLLDPDASVNAERILTQVRDRVSHKQTREALHAYISVLKEQNDGQKPNH